MPNERESMSFQKRYYVPQDGWGRQRENGDWHHINMDTIAHVRHPRMRLQLRNGKWQSIPYERVAHEQSVKTP